MITTERVIPYTMTTEPTIKNADVKYCLRCGRKLKSEQAQLVGMGKICLEKSRQTENRRRLFDADHNT